LVELPGVQEKDRVRKLLQGAARLEFWETYNNTDAEIRNGLLALNNLVKEISKSEKQSVPVVPETITQTPAEKTATAETSEVSTEEAPALLQQLTEDSTLAAGDTAAATPDAFLQDNPLFSVLIPYVNQNGELIPGSVFGQVHYKDTAKVNLYLRMAIQRNLFPRNFKYFWSALPITNPGTKNLQIFMKCTPLRSPVVTAGHRLPVM